MIWKSWYLKKISTCSFKNRNTLLDYSVNILQQTGWQVSHQHLVGGCHKASQTIRSYMCTKSYSKTSNHNNRTFWKDYVPCSLAKVTLRTEYSVFVRVYHNFEFIFKQLLEIKPAVQRHDRARKHKGKLRLL